MLTKTEHRKKKQNLGIFYTPPEIVDFIYDILLIWKEQDEKENKRWESKKHYPSVIDPAVGEGIFLKTALEKGFTKHDYIFGLDIDHEVVKRWPELSLLDAFHGDNEKLEAHFFHQNGLDKIHWEQHIDKYKYKLKAEDIRNQQFDAVVGNPPFGGLGIDFKDHSNNGAFDLLESFKNFEIFTYRKIFTKSEKAINDVQGSLFGVNEPVISSYLKSDKIAKFAEGTPIEVLFLERFIQLAKPDGWIAIIVPDGILSNSNLEYVRKFIASKCKVEGIISLPRDTFKNSGTNAKTSIMFLKKYKQELNLTNGNLKELEYPVFLTTINTFEVSGFNQVMNKYNDFYNSIKN